MIVVKFRTQIDTIVSIFGKFWKFLVIRLSILKIVRNISVVVDSSSVNIDV